MSLMIHTIVPDGIIVSADTRTTCKDSKGNIRYDDSAEKIIAFPNYTVVSHCGNANIRNGLTVTKFLYNLREKYGAKSTCADLPLKLLEEYILCKGKEDVIFKISGLSIGGKIASTYTIRTKEKSIVLSISPLQYGASYNGITDLAHSIMNLDIDYSILSISDAIILTQKCVQANIDFYQYCNDQSIGGKCQTYVIDTLHDKVGWLLSNGDILPDEKVSNNALEKYYQQQINAK